MVVVPLLEQIIKRSRPDNRHSLTAKKKKNTKPQNLETILESQTHQIFYNNELAIKTWHLCL